MKRTEEKIINMGAILMLTPWLIRNAPMVVNGYLKKRNHRR